MQDKLLLRSRLHSVSKLFPGFDVEGRRVILAVNELGAVTRRGLKDEGAIVSLAHEREKIIAALDLLF